MPHKDYSLAPRFPFLPSANATFPCPDGGPTRRTCNNPLQSSRISGPSESGLGPGTLWLSSQYLCTEGHNI
ncbi:hypothetical protein NQZ68_010310 [Dissostichus eleginoides]|nr:hypothetical protein NQZ68_010310 [Dissostichus eleginoides]